MNKKEFYTSPEVEAFEVRFEGVVCQSPKGGTAPKYDDGYDDQGWDA